MLLFLVTSCLVVAVQPCMEWITILKKSFLRFRNQLHLFVLSTNFLMRKYSIYFTNAITQNLWNELDLIFKNDFSLFDLTLQAAFLGFLNIDSKLLLIQNLLLLIFKVYIYNSRRSESLKIKSLVSEIMKVKNIEEKISINNEKNHTMYKWK